MNLTLGAHPDCIAAPECAALSGPLHAQLSTGQYDWPASILHLDDIDAYLAEHRTARKRAQHARILGYTFRSINREEHVDEIHAINTSMPVRQGRPMSAGYLERPNFSPLPHYQCVRHYIRPYGVFSPTGELVAYLVLYVCGDVAMVSQILGHSDHLADDVMYLLAVETFRETLSCSGQVVVFYNRHDSGTDGLRYFKERLGLQPERVAWIL